MLIILTAYPWIEMGILEVERVVTYPLYERACLLFLLQLFFSTFSDGLNFLKLFLFFLFSTLTIFEKVQNLIYA